MRALLQEADLPIEFWDEAVKTDYYIRNRAYYAKLKINGKRTCPEAAFTGETPSINYIRI